MESLAAQPHFKYELRLTSSGHFYNCRALWQVKSARRLHNDHPLLLAPKFQLLGMEEGDPEVSAVRVPTPDKKQN